jgi:Secretion system C-terminal sorting domain
MELKFFPGWVIIFFFLPCISFGQDTFDFYISNAGKDTYPGNKIFLPKQTIAATAPLLANCFKIKGNVKVGLKGGDVFNENLITSYPIELGTYTDDNFSQNDFAILNGSKEFNSGWIKDSLTANAFEQDIPYTGFTGYGINGIGSYSYIYVTEIDKALENTAPFTARKLLKFVTTITDVESTPGSFYSPINTNENPKHIFIHTSDGSSPNSNAKYRYEVTVRDWAVNSTYQSNNIFENLWVHGFGAGNGILPGGDNSYYNKIIFGPGAGIHHVVVRSGTINHSLFLPGAKNTSGFAVVFYDVEGLGRHCTIKNSIFLDIPSPVYSHTSLGTNYGAVELNNVVGFADTTDANAFMYTSNNDTALLNNVYTDGYTSGYNYATAKYSSINNSYFKDVKFGIAYSANNAVNASVNNVFIKTKGNSYTTGIYMQPNTSLTLTNSITHVINNYRSYWANAASFVYGTGISTNKISASGNIFICDIAPVATLIAANTNAVNGISADSWNNNVYILLKGNKIEWTTSNPSANGGSSLIQNFDEWERLSGQDKNSLFFDLRNDPRGLKVIFVDPDNGNYDLANTPEGYQIAALHAGMTTPLNCFLQKPTYEQAADLIRNSAIPSVDACRNPCRQNTIRINNSFETKIITDRQVSLYWNISEQHNINYYELQKAIGNSVFKKLCKIPVSTDSIYSYIDDIQPGITYQYRLVITDHAGGRCYSGIQKMKINDNKAFTIYPNPSTGKFFISMNGYIGIVNFIIANSNGQTIVKKQTFSLYNEQELDLTTQPKGIYFLKVETTKGITVQKFLIQ